jgi:hypothetical protein
LENHVGKSQRTNTKIVATRDGREMFNILLVFCRAGSNRRRLRRRVYVNGCNGLQQTALFENYVGNASWLLQEIEVSVDDAVWDWNFCWI